MTWILIASFLPIVLIAGGAAYFHTKIDKSVVSLRSQNVSVSTPLYSQVIKVADIDSVTELKAYSDLQIRYRSNGIAYGDVRIGWFATGLDKRLYLGLVGKKRAYIIDTRDTLYVTNIEGIAAIYNELQNSLIQGENNE